MLRGMLLEDYGLIGDLESAALVGRNGSMDWLCLPRFDSASCFTALLGDERHGRWLLAPAGDVLSTSRRYRPGTLVLETDFETAQGAVRVIDFMPRRGLGAAAGHAHRRGPAGPGADAHGAGAAARLRVDPAVGRSAPRMGRSPPPVLTLSASARRCAAGGGRNGARRVRGGRGRARAADADLASLLRGRAAGGGCRTRRSPARRRGGGRGAGGAVTRAPYREQVLTSLIALKAMTSESTGAVIAAPTTSLPEELGGVRNWDYRYCWLRDSVLDARSSARPGLHRGGGRLPRLPAARRYRRPAGDADHVRDRRRAAADRVRAR